MMRGRNLFVALVATMACFLASAGGASAKTALTLETAAGPLAAGAPIELTSSDMIIFWNLPSQDECTTNLMIGSLDSNGAAKIGASFEEAIFEGEWTVPPRCKNSGSQGPTTLVATGLPWHISLLAKGKGKLTGTPKLGFIETFVVDPGSPKCTWAAGKLAFTFATSGELVLTFDHQQLTRVKAPNDNELCQKHAELTGHFQAVSGGEPVLAHT